MQRSISQDQKINFKINKSALNETKISLKHQLLHDADKHHNNVKYSSSGKSQLSSHKPLAKTVKTRYTIKQLRYS